MILAGAEPEKSMEVDEGQLSFHLAGSLPLDLDFKQTLLGMKSEAERLRAIISFFETILPTMRRTVHVRRKAGGPKMTVTKVEEWMAVMRAHCEWFVGDANRRGNFPLTSLKRAE